MTNKRCSQCSFLNFATASECKRCKAQLDSAAATEWDSHQSASAENYPQPGEGASPFWDQPSFPYQPKYVPQPVASGSVASRIVRILVIFVVLAGISALAIPKLLKSKKADFTNISWTDYQSPDGKFSVSLPAPPKESSRVIPSPFGNAQAHLIEAQVNNEGGCMLLYADYPIEHINIPDETLYDMALAGAAMSRQNIFTIGNRKYVTLDGRRGVEAELKPIDPQMSITGTVRIFWVSPRLYVVVAFGPDTAEFKPVGTRCLDSFKLLRGR